MGLGGFCWFGGELKTELYLLICTESLYGKNVN